MTIIGFAVKSGITFTAIYWTNQHKVWGTSQEASDLYDKLRFNADPTIKSLKSQMPFDAPVLPSSGETCYLVKHYYNNGVKKTFNFIHRMPCYLGQWAKQARDAIDSAVAAPPPIPAAVSTPAIAAPNKK